ncbi:uncharacterized protein DMENIID0001_063950 [Sergentomyia squamirostris]
MRILGSEKRVLLIIDSSIVITFLLRTTVSSSLIPLNTLYLSVFVMLKFLTNPLLLAMIPVFMSSVKCQDNGTVEFDPTQRYCFKFTWLGPQYDNNSNFLESECEKVDGIPCFRPLVVTYNSNEPDTKWMWEQQMRGVLCRQARGDVCVKYTYTFNHVVQNITYFCTKVNIENEGAATSGCYTEYRNGREIEVCICESRVGQRPCNDATEIISHNIGLFVIGFVIIVLHQWASR